MESGSGSGGGGGKGKVRARPGPWPPRIEQFVPIRDHSPRELLSWARRTGFNSNNLSGESTTEKDTGHTPATVPQRDKDLPPAPRRPGIEPVSRRTRDGDEPPVHEISPVPAQNAAPKEDNLVPGDERHPSTGLKVGGSTGRSSPSPSGNGNGGSAVAPVDNAADQSAKDLERGDGEAVAGLVPNSSTQGMYRRDGIRGGVMDNPGHVISIFYGLQHYLSLAGSLVFIPLIIVPAMNGTDEETATVISTMLLVSGVTTLLHSFVGSRLPLVHGSSFVYLAPVLVIINSEEFRNLSENKFKHIMKELQGAIIVGSVFQMIMGYSGLISLFIRLINPVVVAPTVAAVGLAFFSYGFPQASMCAEISVPLILLLLIFSLHLRKVSIFRNHVFQVYAVPLGVAIVWAYAFFLTAGGAYKYEGCNSNIPSSNIVFNACKKHAEKMKHCRTDASNAWKTAAWVRIPYPFQWGSPAFHFKTSLIMIIVSLVASVDSVGVYHSASILVNIRPPTPCIVSRAIGLEGCSSILAGLWGTGTGSTALTENIHTIDVTKIACRRAVQLGAALMIFLSFMGKVGALLASIPLALAAAVLCFTWALVVSLGLSTLQYTQTASSRNILIVGFTLFISMSIPAYFQQYQPTSGLVLPSYFVPYSAASSGPIQLGNEGFSYALNALLSLNMVVALFVAFVLDNTVPGSKQERGAYIWSSSSEVDQSSLEPYMLPTKVWCFGWARCFGS